MDTAGASKKTLLETFNMVKLKQQNELHKENEFCDLNLKSEDGFEIKVHKLVVSSASNYFKDLLTLPMKEKFEESILLPDITGDVLEKIITFVYTSEFEEEIEDVEKIVKYAVIFQLEQLVEICSLVLSESINDGTCLKYWRLAGNNLIYGLEEKCLEYIVSKADHLFENSLMSDLTIKEMQSLLADKRLHLQWDEKKIFEHVWKWAEGKVSETESFSQLFSEVVDLLDFSKLEKEFVFDKLFGGNEDVLTNAELLKKVSQLTKQKFKDEVASRYTFHKPTQRKLFGLASNKMFIGLGEETSTEKELNLRRSFGYTTFNNKLLICGGEVEGSITNSCELFEPSTQEWKEFQSMKTGRQWHQCLYLDSKIYACGGYGNNTVEIFDFGKGEWNYGPEMLADNWSFGLTGVNGALYVIGGSTENVEILDPRRQKWIIVCSDFRHSSFVVRCVSIGPRIYCFTEENRYIFDTRSNKFTEQIRCKNFDNFFQFCELDGYIYGFGYNESSDKYYLNLVQYHLDGKVGFKKFYGLYSWSDCKSTAIVSLYY